MEAAATNKKNDVNWCMQFFGLILGIGFLLAGTSVNPEFWTNWRENANFIFGFSWLFLALVHRMKWKHKVAMRSAESVASSSVRDSEIERV